MTPHDLAPAYAVDALDAEDLALFTGHLDDCASCRDQVASVRGAAAMLGASGALSVGGPGAPVAAPASLRASVLASVGSTPQAPPTQHPATQQPSKLDPAPVGAARSRRLIPVAWIGMAAAAILAAAFGIVIGGYLSSNPDGPALAAHEQAMRIISAPDAHTTSVPLGRSSLVMSADYAGAVLMGDTTPMPAAGTEYQVWMGHADGTAAPGPTFMPDAAGTYMVLMSGNMGDVAKVFVTAEPMGGSPSPTGPMVADVTLGK